MALLSLVFLLLAIMLGFIRKMNTGLLCIAFALLLGRMAGISDAEIIKGFNASLFLMLLGVTYLFSLAQINGSLDLLAQKVISLAGKRVYLIKRKRAKLHRDAAEGVFNIPLSIQSVSLGTKDDIGVFCVDIQQDGDNVRKRLLQPGAQLVG